MAEHGEPAVQNVPQRRAGEGRPPDNFPTFHPSFRPLTDLPGQLALKLLRSGSLRFGKFFLTIVMKNDYN